MINIVLVLLISARVDSNFEPSLREMTEGN